MGQRDQMSHSLKTKRLVKQVVNLQFPINYLCFPNGGYYYFFVTNIDAGNVEV